LKRKSEVEKKVDKILHVSENMDKEVIIKLNSKHDFDHAHKRASKLQFGALEPENNFLDFISGFCSLIKTKKSLNEIYKCFNFYSAKLGYEFSAICIPDKNKEVLNVQTFNSEIEQGSFQFLISDEYNYLTQSYLDKSRKYATSKELFMINCAEKMEYLIMPLIYQGDSFGMVVAGSMRRDRNKDEVLNTLCGYLTLLISNYKIKDALSLFNETDNLTGLYTHGKFQETLTEVLKEAKENKQKASVVIFDINNLAGINREFGHSKGDEVISAFAKEIKTNLREKDIAARYGSDEIVVIMPETSNETAKSAAKNILSNIFKLQINKIGKIKASVGISTYPTSAVDQEKLLILAEQSMLISKNQGQQNNNSSILSSNDVNFWNKTSLESLSAIINRRNFPKFNYEDELVKQFQIENKTSKISWEIVTSLAAAIDAKDTYTRGHSQSVSKYAETLAKALELDEHTVEQIKLGAILHDIGKIGISETILRKPGPLTDHEWEVMKQHPIIGVKKILEPIKSLKDLIPTVRHHHERIDGLGYPDRLRGDEIPLGAKIVAIADAFHALISHRPYRKAAGEKKALEILKAGADKQWDKDLVETFVKITPIFFIGKN